MSVFAEAIQQSMVASMDPMTAIVRGMMSGQAKAQDLELARAKREFVKELRKDLEEAKANGEDGNSIAAIQRMIDDWSK